VRRLVAATLLAALVAGALICGGRPVGQAHAATGPCVKHTKRVVRHVKRHGRRTRVVHVRHYRTCEEAPAPVTPAPTPVPAPTLPAPTLTPTPVTETPPVTPQPEPEANALGVTAEDSGGLRYVLSRPTVRAGRLTVQLANKGEDPHTMDMQRVGPNGELEGPVLTELATEPGEAPHTATVEVQPGTYRMWCTIGHHAEHGMKAEITVE
jgi:plastocyanin